MANANDARRAHKIIEDIIEGYEPTLNDMETLRSFLPELPKQKTLEEILEEVESAACSMMNSYWSQSLNPQDWLWELHAQLKGLKGAPVAVPALPAGMRLADHEQYGRVITSPKPNRDGIYDLLVPRPKFETGADWEYAHECELTFIDAEPVHPEFLETEADYENAPEGTIVACDDSPPCHKFGSEWSSVLFCGMKDDRGMSRVIRRVLRWGNE